MLSQLQNNQSAAVLDAADPLAQFRQEFYLREGVIYLDGNSLGLASKPVEKVLLESIEEWKTFAIDGWTQGPRPWFFTAEEIGAKLAPLIGAKPEEVIATGSITVNLHQLVATFFKPEGKRTRILADELNFPTDIYALKAQLALHGLSGDEHLIRVRSRDGYNLSEEDIIAAMDDTVALMLLPSVLYRSGQLLDIKRLTREAQKRGIIAGWDLAHSIGSVPHRLHDWNVDFAVWCNYKYLNGGPGAHGGLYVHKCHFGKTPGLAGWYGSDKKKQFDMEHDLVPANNAGAYQTGTPSIFGLAPLFGSLDIFERATMERIRRKSLAQTDYLIARIEEKLSSFGFRVITPLEHCSRGGHISIEHPEGARIAKAMKERGIVPDYRNPNVIRLAPIALYTSWADIDEAVERVRLIMVSKEYEQFSNERGLVA